ncbi:DNA-binding protein YbiB [Sulfurimicrobium lacus]|uniref:DNA-binding protein YbiB n=1 Tax=Sulfurimicrobium lacus TaxID=2715678 RepID=A0A6F8VCR3_9PROT|nr:DNA-binding protein YbiB [Sulfurimicrobium lacus]BCB26529.1 DNA-binding protein YbiB [Sulfurimicrobium lacus]
MSIATLIRELGRGQASLAESEAHSLFAAMLDGGVEDLELGALLYALRTKGESLDELLGFQRAVEERLYKLKAPHDGIMPVVIPAYGGGQETANLLPLFALLLQHFGIPVLLHGTLENHDGMAASYVLRELGILPCVSLSQAQHALDQEGLAFVPTAVLCPGLASMLSLRNRLGLRNSAHLMVKLLQPFSDAGLHLVSASQPDWLEQLRTYLLATEAHALLLQSCDGEPFANPMQRPQLEHLNQGSCEILFEAERSPTRSSPNLPKAASAAATALWTKQILAGEVPLPLPLVNQLACCLYGTGYAQDMNQAKAIAAIEAGGLAAA